MAEIRTLIADVLQRLNPGSQITKEQADAILAHPDIRAIIDLAAAYDEWSFDDKFDGEPLDFEPFENAAIALETPKARALLADWRNDA